MPTFPMPVVPLAGPTKRVAALELKPIARLLVVLLTNLSVGEFP